MIMVTYRVDADALADIDGHRPAHLAHARSYADMVRFAVTGKCPVTGEVQRAIFILDIDDEDVVRQFVADEPYLASGIFTSPEITRADVRMGALAPLPASANR